MTHKTKWLVFAPLGLVTIGAGASMVHWAGTQGLAAQPLHMIGYGDEAEADEIVDNAA